MCFKKSEEFRFLKSFSSIPLINSALHLGSNVYFNVKTWNPYLETTLSGAEQMVVYIANTPTVTRVAHRIELPVLFVDKLAADGLQMLEDKYPAIRMTPENVKEEAHKQMVVMRGVGAKKLDQLVSSVCHQRRVQMERAFLLLESMFGPKVSIYVDVIEKTVNEYLPPIEDESTDQEIDIYRHNKQRVFARLAYIPHTVHERIIQRYNQFVLQVTWNEEPTQTYSYKEEQSRALE